MINSSHTDILLFFDNKKDLAFIDYDTRFKSFDEIHVNRSNHLEKAITQSMKIILYV